MNLVAKPQLLPFRRHQRRSHPFAHGMRFSAVEAARHGILRRAARTNGPRNEGVESLAALAAFPEHANGRRSLATGTGEALAAR